VEIAILVGLILIIIVFFIWLPISLYLANNQIKKLEKKITTLSEKNELLKEKIADLSNRNEGLNKENSNLLAENAILEAENLKFQLHPHTLGNAVSTLDGIVSNLHRGTAALTQTINYVLYGGKSHLVTVEEEIKFVKQFTNMHSSFDSEIIDVKIDQTNIDSDSLFYKTACIPHLISAYLIENAYNHGDKSHPDFLKIYLKLNNDLFEMVVINRIKPKKETNEPGGIGLKNMQKRLELLTGGKFEITNSCNEESYHSTLKIFLK
jgi:two-component system LytT family sensor kinase